MTLGPIGSERDGAPGGVEARFQDRPTLGRRAAPTEPVGRPRDLPGRLDVGRIGGEPRAPELDGPPGFGEVGPVGVQRVRVVGDCRTRGICLHGRRV